MNNKIRRALQDIQSMQKLYLKSVILPGDTAVDATAGLGRDTLFLAECVGPEGKVYAFDIQEDAISATSALLEKQGLSERVQLIRDSHTEILSYVTEKAGAVVFNLGYLPQSDHRIITKAHTTIQAVESALKCLKTGGIMCLTVYRGHEGGVEESNALLEFFSDLSKQDFSILQGRYINQGDQTPYWIMIQKNREDSE